MHFVKWIRKNERKIMTFVVIFIMIAFVGGTAFQQLMSRIGGHNKAVAYFGNKEKITSRDVLQAQSELNVLRILMFDKLLHFGLSDIASRLLGQLLFPDLQIGALLSDEMKKAVLQGQFLASGEDIDVFFSQAAGRSELYWLLLKAEARKAGCLIPDSQARELLKQIVPQLSRGQIDAKQLVGYIIKEHRVPEEGIIRVVADFWGVQTYARMITSSENVTINQVKAVIGRDGEKIDAEFVRIGASDFSDARPEPSGEELTEQFERYKQYSADLISDDNPYGFGYKLPARVALDYLILNMDDVQTLITEPEQEEMEEFYQRNVGSPQYQYIFKYEELTDPNDPESKVERIRSYADASGLIRRVLVQEKTDRQADMIMNEAMELTEAAFVGVDVDKAGTEELKKLAGDYKQVAAKLSEKYKIGVHAGQTGMLSAGDVAADEYLRRLLIEGRNQSLVPLSKVLFAIEEINADQAGRLDVTRPKMWVNIGPMKDMFGSMVAIIRVVGASKASEPADLNVSFSREGVVLDESEQSEENIYSVKDAVVRDVKLLKAMEVAKGWADELVELIGRNGWDEALDEFNKIHSDAEDASSVQLRLDELLAQTRVSLLDIKHARMQSVDDPSAAMYIKNKMATKKLLDELYSLLPAGKTEATDIMPVVEFKPGACYYVVKSVSRTTVTNRDYAAKKAQTALVLDSARSESLALIYFRPENIIRRMNYRPADSKGDKPAEEKKQEKSDGAS